MAEEKLSICLLGNACGIERYIALRIEKHEKELEISCSPLKEATIKQWDRYEKN